MFTDKQLECKDCGRMFEFTAGEQEFFSQKGFTNEPSRCPSCRAARKNNRNREQNRGYGNRPSRQTYEVTCDSCGKLTQVPFQPSGSRPVYCSDCFRSKSRAQ